MKITVYFALGDVMEWGNIVSSRRFWRYVSKHCKRMTRLYGDTLGVERVVKVVKEVANND